MSHIFVPNGIRVLLQGHDENGGELLHVFHVKAPDPHPTAADCTAVNNLFHQWAFNDYKTHVNSGVFFDQLVSTGTDAVPAAQVSLPLGFLGTEVGPFVPTALTLPLKAATLVSGRRNRGGQAPWPTTTADLQVPDTDRWSDTYRAAILASFNSLLAYVNANNYPLVVLSQADAALHPINTYVAVSDYVRGRSSRFQGVGR